MALVSSGTIQLGIPATQPANRNISSEFGDTPGEDSISEYYRGGAYVPNSPFTSGIPSSGTISFSNFYGAARYTPISVNIGNMIRVAVDCSRPYSMGGNRTTSLSVSGGNGSYTRDWDGPNAFSGSFIVRFQNIDNQTAANINIFSNNNSANAGGEFNRNANYNVNVTDGSSSANRAFQYNVNFNQGCF